MCLTASAKNHQNSFLTGFSQASLVLYSQDFFQEQKNNLDEFYCEDEYNFIQKVKTGTFCGTKLERLKV